MGCVTCNGAVIDKLQEENDQLKARIAELEEMAAQTFPKRPISVDGFVMFEVNDYNDMVGCFNNRTPAQSLARVKAEAVRQAVDELRRRADLRSYDYKTNEIRSMLDREMMMIAQRIEEEAK